MYLLGLNDEGDVKVDKSHMACFVDILGMRSMLDDALVNETELEKIYDITKEFYSHFAGYLSFKDAKYSVPVVHVFSDCVYLSVPRYEPGGIWHSPYDYYGSVIHGLAFAQGYMMVEKGIFLRGGISIGTSLASKNVEVSTAYYKAYIIESKYAIYPVVAILGLTPDAFANLPGIEHYGGVPNSGLPNDDVLVDVGLRDENDNILYVLDYLNVYLNELYAIPCKDINEVLIQSVRDHKRRIIEAYDKNRENSHIAEKYKWLGLNYHNYFVAKHINGNDSLMLSESDFMK